MLKESCLDPIFHFMLCYLSLYMDQPTCQPFLIHNSTNNHNVFIFYLYIKDQTDNNTRKLWCHLISGNAIALVVMVFIWRITTYYKASINILIEVAVMVFGCPCSKFTIHVLLCTHPIEVNRVVSATLGKGELREQSSKSGPLLMSRPLDVKLKRKMVQFSPTGIDDTVQQCKHEKVLAMTFFLPGQLRMLRPYCSTYNYQCNMQQQFKLAKVKFLWSLHMKSSAPRSMKLNCFRTMIMERHSFSIVW